MLHSIRRSFPRRTSLFKLSISQPNPKLNQSLSDGIKTRNQHSNSYKILLRWCSSMCRRSNNNTFRHSESPITSKYTVILQSSYHYTYFSLKDTRRGRLIAQKSTKIPGNVWNNDDNE